MEQRIDIPIKGDDRTFFFVIKSFDDIRRYETSNSDENSFVPISRGFPGE